MKIHHCIALVTMCFTLLFLSGSLNAAPPKDGTVSSAFYDTCEAYIVPSSMIGTCNIVIPAGIVRVIEYVSVICDKPYNVLNPVGVTITTPYPNTNVPAPIPSGPFDLFTLEDRGWMRSGNSKMVTLYADPFNPAARNVTFDILRSAAGNGMRCDAIISGHTVPSP